LPRHQQPRGSGTPHPSPADSEMASPYGDDGPLTDPKMADLTNRLPYMDLDELANRNPTVPVKTVTVWRPTKKVGGPGTVLTCDVLTSWPNTKGSFAHSCGKTEDHPKLELSGTDPSDSLPSRCYDKKMFVPVYAKDVSCVGGLATSGGEGGASDQRREIAKACGIKGAFAVWRDGAVWEFAYGKAIEEEDKVEVDMFVADNIGGSCGIAAATQALSAVAKLKSKKSLRKDAPKAVTAGA